VLLRRTPAPALAGLVESLWYLDETGAAAPAVRAARERALPTGSADLVLRLTDEPVRIFDGLEDRVGRRYRGAVLAGARAAFHVRDTSRPT
jgi:hypothetical protein